MTKSIEKLRSMIYPGRLIILGKDVSGVNDIVVYAVTGRSPSSQARKIVWEKDSFWVKPTDKELIQTGNIDLLVYPALFVLPQGIAVSNGKQTVDIMASLSHSLNASEILAFSLKEWDYEPDAPSYTPRISGCLLPTGNAALSVIIKNSGDSSIRNIFEFPLFKGKGLLTATYSGENIDPLPSFRGEPIEVDLSGSSSQEVIEGVYSDLAPDDPDKDFRVAAACLFINRKNRKEIEYHIINRKDRA